jgi:hypothetical protein
LVHWKNPIDELKKLKEHLHSGGMIALVHQPRNPSAKEEDVTEAGEKFAEYLKAAGFKETKIEQKKMNPISSVCVLGKK